MLFTKSNCTIFGNLACKFANSPLKSLLPIINIFKLDRLAKSLGSLPKNALLAKTSSSKFTRLEIALGTIPNKLLSKKYPVYLKYGAGLAFPVFSQIRDLTVNTEGFETYNSLSATYVDYDFLADFVTKRSLSINVGIGILIR